MSVPPAMMVGMRPEHALTTPLVGRAAELDRIETLLGLDGDAAAHAVVLAGDAGVGKTRLLTELRARAEARSWRTLTGHCLDFGDAALPYLPFTEMLGRLAGTDPAVAAGLADANPAVGRLLPGRRTLSGASDADDRAVDRGALFEALHATFEQLGATAPTLLVVEDAHWADRSTRDVISFLLARGFAAPVVLVVSYRSDDIHRRHPLRPAVAEWARLPGVVRLQLPPLSDVDIRTLARAVGEGSLGEADMQAIVDRADGNAFFAEELVGAASHHGRRLPADLADLLLVRTESLDDAARVVVRAASAAGRRVSHQLIASVAPLSGPSLDAAIRSAVENHVLVDVDGRYAFRHALLAEAVYEDLVPGEAVRLHAAYVAALTSLEVPGTAAELARHARLAHDTEVALAASIEAGDEAMAVGGPDEAATHYERALEVLAESPAQAAPDTRVDVVDLTVRAAEAVTAAGHPQRAAALLQDHLAMSSEVASSADRARLLAALAGAVLMSESTLNPLDATTEALALVPPGEHEDLRAEILSVHALANAERGRDDDAARWAQLALELAQEIGLPKVLAEAQATLGRLEERAGDPETSRRAYLAVVEQARVDGNASSELRGLHYLAALEMEAGRLASALRAYQDTARRSEELGRPWAPYGFDARALSGIVAYAVGQWAVVDSIVDVSGQAPPPIAEALLRAVGMQVAAGRGEASAAALLDDIRPWWRKDGLIAIVGAAAGIDLLGDARDLEAVLALYDEAVTAVGTLWENDDFAARMRLSALALGQIGANLPAIPDGARHRWVSRAGELAADSARAAARRHSRRPMGPEGIAWVARAKAELARVHWLAGMDAPTKDELVGCWQDDVAAFDAFGHVVESARSRVRLGEVLHAAGRRREAREPIAAARSVATSLGSAPLLAQIERLGAGGAGGAAHPSSRTDEALTPREQEVLTLVADGRSNGEVARQLFISTKTVSVHVSNILAKLGAAGRTEAAAIARRQGLLDG